MTLNKQITEHELRHHALERQIEDKEALVQKTTALLEASK
jgi:hypothetical protein